LSKVNFVVVGQKNIKVIIVCQIKLIGIMSAIWSIFST